MRILKYLLFAVFFAVFTANAPPAKADATKKEQNAKFQTANVAQPACEVTLEKPFVPIANEVSSNLPKKVAMPQNSCTSKKGCFVVSVNEKHFYLIGRWCKIRR